jgi:dienelactone hydrolase
MPKFFVPKSKEEGENMMDKKPWPLAILLIFGLTACATKPSEVKKETLHPKDVNIIPPGLSAFTAIDVSFVGSTKKLFGGFETLKGKLSKPQGDGPFPAVVLMHGCPGVTKWDHVWANRLARWGYVPFVVDSFGPRGVKSVCVNPTLIPAHVRSKDAYAAKAYLSGLPFVDRNRISVIGWSHGGSAVLDIVVCREQKDPFRAAFAFYPYCEYFMRDSNAPLLILIGKLDDWTPAALCRKIMPSGKAAKEIALKVYPRAHHAFDYGGIDTKVMGHRLLYNPEALADSIVQVREFLGQYLK